MTVTFGELTYDVAGPGTGDGLPILDDRGQARATTDDLALLGGGAVPRRGTVLPYDAQRTYDGVARPTTLRTAVVADDRASATFLLDLGGRLWSLVVDGHEVLHRPTPLQVGNLALRNAWFAGGTEWNLGFTGHWPLTCAPVHAGVVSTPHGQVLRLWEHERMLGLVWRLDAVVRDGTLYVHPVLANPYDHDVAVYWWSNTAVPLRDGARVLVAATDAWHYDDSRTLSLVAVPGEPDQTYPGRVPGSADHFFRVAAADRHRPWICAVDEAGEGFGQASTARLPGRKLFRWGTGRGGRRWQEWLSPAGGPGYLEVQAGLAATQLEHLPLPAGERWEWTEAYGRVAVAGAHGPWDAAVDAARAAVDAMAPHLTETDALLTEVRDAPVDVRAQAGRWGALEVAAGHLPHDPATPFGEPGPEQQPWLALVRDARLGAGDPPAPVTGPAWRRRLAAAEGPVADYLAGIAALADDARDEALPRLAAAAAAGLWQARRALGMLAADPAERVAHLEAAVAVRACDPWLLVDLLAALDEAGRHDEVVARVAAAPPHVQALGRVRLARVRAALGTGDLATVRDLLDGPSPLQVPDLREGEDSLGALWAAYQRLAGTDEPLPAAYDFRMRP